MILEIAQIDIKPGMESKFEAGVKAAAPIFQRAKGCQSMELQRSIEKPSRYRLFVEMADSGKSHSGFPRFGGFPGMAQAGRRLLRGAARSRAYEAGRERI